MKILTLFNFADEHVPQLADYIDEVDMCVPNQSQSIPDLIARYSAGVPLPEKQALFFGDKVPTDVSGQPYDIVDIMTAKRQLNIDYDTLSANLDNMVKEQQERDKATESPTLFENENNNNPE